MFSKRRFRRNKPRSPNFLENGEQKKEVPFIPPVQTKLNIGQPGDVYEVEADKTADEVVNKTTSRDSIQKMGAEEEEVQAKPLSQGLTPFVQKQEAEDEEPVQKMKEEEEPLQAKQEEKEPVQAQEEEEEPVQAQEEEEEEEPVQAKSRRTNKVGGQFEKQLGEQKGKGQKLDAKDRIPLEAAFGADFSSINIHTGGKANTLNKQLNAKAFTHGADIFFKNGNFNPRSKQGRHLLAHELTHTVQQGAIDTTKPAGSHKKAGRIQRAPIDYRGITWADFNGTAEAESKYDAATASALHLDMHQGYISGAVEWDGKTATVTISFNSKLIFLKGIMETDESWKKNWLTDDKAAEDKFGKEVDFGAKREALLSHEQIHFKITNSIAKKYVKPLRDAIPKNTYTESAPAASEDAMKFFLDATLKRKGEEINTAVDAVYNKADTEVDAVQDIYDKGTRHSQRVKKQQKWKDEFNKMLKAAREKGKAAAAGAAAVK